MRAQTGLAFGRSAVRVLALAVLAATALVACRAERDAPAPAGEAPIPCKTDADCRSPACGPCKSGEVLKRGGPSCTVNPCPGVPVVCSPQKVCVVR